MEEFGLHRKLLNLIKTILNHTKSEVKFRDVLSEAFKINIGHQKGDALSPMLFNCALEQIMRGWSKKKKL